jgi:hypothetical protein
MMNQLQFKLGLALVSFIGCGLLSSDAWALPQFSVRSARQCNNCHVDPKGWSNPEVKARKCTLSCNGCHVNPTGGGMRNVSGGYYGREILPMFGRRPSDSKGVGQVNPPPSSQPSSKVSADPPMGWVSKISLTELPALSMLGSQHQIMDGGPGTASRYGGMDPFPLFQIGTDLRTMIYRDQSQGKTSIFPMQVDLHLAVSPLETTLFNEGRLTFLTTVGIEGSRSEAYKNVLSRFFVKEYFGLYDNLPYNLYAKAGRFLPAFGWRLDDHTSFVRQNFTFDHEGQKTGVEVGINPNYAYAHASFFNSASNWKKPFDHKAGYGTALHMGYRELLWQAGASFMYEGNDSLSGVWAGANWSLNIHDATEHHPWKGLDWVPVIYLGEFDYRRQTPAGGGRSVNSLAAFHELNWLIIQGLNIRTRYDWKDADLELKDDHRHRYTFGLVFHPYTFVEVSSQFRLNVLTAGDNFSEALLTIHGWY